LDFFSVSGARSGEQLLNMIDMCTVFSVGKDKDCSVFRSLFSLEPDKQEVLKLALESLRTAAVGRQISNQSKEAGVRDLRNTMFHDFLTLDTRSFQALVTCATQLLESVRVVVSCIRGEHRSDFIDEALAEIAGMLKRDLIVAKLSEDEREVLHRQNKQMLEELELMQLEKRAMKEKLGRKFDSLAVCLKTDIQDDILKPGNEIGSGAHGTVCRVRYRGQTLAVKLFHSKEAQSKAMRRELNSLMALTHSSIVRMFYTVYETLDDRRALRAPLGYAMEIMARSANDKLNCTLSQLLCIFEQVANALTFAHEQNVVHFDVKPENILLDDACAVAKLCDFGCAITLHTTASMTFSESGMSGKIRGTIFYMAPEAYHGIITDHEKAKLCDIFSFGKTMWKLLHQSEDLDPFSECKVTASVPHALKHLVEQCTQKPQSARPQSMSEVLKQLHVIQASEGAPS
jgi:RIO-like serine/threonine protein kinase